MDKSELAAKMLQWEKADRYLRSLTKTIEKSVLELEKTQTVGNVRATYLKARIGQGDPSVIIEIV